jgi:UrcA family protein
MRRAAERVCGHPNSRSLSVIQQVNNCKADIIEALRPQVELAAAAAKPRGLALAASR